MGRGWWIIVIVVVGCSVFFRLHGLDQKLFWHDEVYTKIFAAGYQSRDWQAVLYSGRPVPVAEVLRFQRHDPTRGVLDTVAGLAHDEPQHPPLYYIVARAWSGCVGESVAALRLLSALASLLALPGIFWLAGEAFRRRRVSIVATMLLAASPFFILYAQEVREYALWSALLLYQSAALLWALRRAQDGWAVWIPYAALTTGALYTSFSTGAVIIAQLAFVAWRERRVGRAFVAALGASGLCFLPWAWTLLEHLESFRASMAWSSDIVIPRHELLGTLAVNTSRQLVDFWAEPSGVGPWLVVLGAVALAVWSVGAAARQGGAAGLLVLTIVIPMGLLLVPDLVFGGIRSLSTRYLIPAWLALLVCVAHFVTSRPGRTGVALAVVVIGVGLASAAHNAGLRVVWTKGISYNLPVVAEAINETPTPLVVGNHERHNPGNLLALSNLLVPGAHLQVLTSCEGYQLPPEGAFSEVFLFSPIPWFRDDLEAEQDVQVEPVFRGLYMELWRVIYR